MTPTRLCNLFTLLLLAGCASAKFGTVESIRDYDSEIRPLVTLRENIDFSSVKVVSEGDSLLESIRIGILRNPDVEAAKRSVSTSDAEIQSAESALEPQITGSVTAGGFTGDLADQVLANGAVVTTQLSQLLFDGGATERVIGTAKIERKLAEIEVASTVNAAAVNSTDTWLSVWRHQTDEAALKDLEAKLLPLAVQVSRMASSGLIDRSVSDSIASRLIEFSLSREQTVAQLKSARFAFDNIFGRAPWQLSYPKLDDLTEQLDNINPETEIPLTVKQNAVDVLLAEEQLDLAQARLLPTLSLSASTSTSADDISTPSGQIGLTVSYDFSDGGRRKAEVKRAEEAVARSKAQLARTRLDANRTINDLLVNRKSSIENNRLIKEKIIVLERQLKIAENQIQTGQSDIAKIFSILVEIHELEVSYREALADLRNTEVQLAAFLGLFHYPNSGDTESHARSRW